MSHFRAWLRLAAFFVWSSLCYLAVLLRVPLRPLSKSAARRLHEVVVRSWGRGCTRLLGVRVQRDGELPVAPYFLVCNHLSYLDIVVLMAHAPATFVAKSEVSRWPFLGRLARGANTIFVDRSRRGDVVRVNTEIAEILRDGGGIFVFPEGTSSPGAEVLPFRSSLLDPAVKIGHPVSFASLAYDTPDGWPTASESVCWWGDMTFPGHFYGLLRLPRIEATLRFGEGRLEADERHELARLLHAAVSAQFVPSSQSHGSA